MADATQCEKPWYHCQVRTPDGEDLTPEQWREVADRLEKKLGLDDQPRAIAFHDKDGHRHMHVAWSRIDDETMTARELNFDHLKLKDACREIERDLGLTPVRNDKPRDGIDAPSREEYEQARRLGLDIHETRTAIRDCWERADNGQSFAAALQDQGLTLAQGDRRDYVVIDQEGGIHALGKRVLGVSAAETRERLSDLDRGSLPTITEAREGLSAELAQPAPAELSVEPTAAAAVEREEANQTAIPEAGHALDDSGVGEPTTGVQQPASPGLNLSGAASSLADGVAKVAEVTLETGFTAAADFFTFGLGSPSPPPRPRNAPDQPPKERPMATQPAPKAPEPHSQIDRGVATNPPHVVMNSADLQANAPKNPTEAPPDLAEQIMAKWRKDRERDYGRDR
jgi:hypothetical protein